MSNLLPYNDFLAAPTAGIRMFRCALILGFLGLPCLTLRADEMNEELVEILPEIHLEFANIHQGRSALLRDDAFVRNLSRFDLACRLQTADQPTLEAWKTMVAEQVQPWPAEERAKVTACLKRLAPKLAAYQLPLPKRTLLVRTTGREEGGAAYCRGAAIVLSEKIVSQTEDRLERLLAHELFHVLSNQNPELRTKLYKLIGFQTMPEISLPEPLRDRKIANPDAPAIDCWIEIGHEDKKWKAAPILFASTAYDAESKKSLFEYLTFRLLLLEETKEGFAAAMKEGEPRLVDPRDLPSYFEQIGKNTGYIIHPDEILADNFAQIVLGGPPPTTPKIHDALREALAR